TAAPRPAGESEQWYPGRGWEETGGTPVPLGSGGRGSGAAFAAGFGAGFAGLGGLAGGGAALLAGEVAGADHDGGVGVFGGFDLDELADGVGGVAEVGGFFEVEFFGGLEHVGL